MSQTIFSDINPAATSGTQLATYLNDFKAALMSGMSGTSRPSATLAGGYWIDTTNDPTYWSYKMYTGAADVEMFRLNLTTATVSITGSDDSFQILKVSADAVGPILKLVKRRVASNGQVLAGDIVGHLQIIGRASDSSNPIVASLKVVAQENETATASGVYVAFETTPALSATAVEHMRLMNGFLGIGTTAPDSMVHARGATGIKSEYLADNASPAKVTVSKSRIAGTGATQAADAFGEYGFNTTDSASAKVQSARIQAVALEAHTGTARGTKLVVSTTTTGAAAVSSKLEIGDKVESVGILKVNSQEIVSQNVATTATIAQLSATKGAVEFTGATTTSVQGINSGHDSKVILLHNRSTAVVTLEHENAGAAAADRIKLPDSTPVAIAAESSVELFYCTTDSRWKLKSGAGTGTATSSGINYVTNGEATVNTTGWATYADAAAATPVDGTGGSPTITWTRTTSSPLTGVASFLFTKDAANRQGQGASYDFTIDTAQKAKVLQIDFDYAIASGTFVAGSSGVDSDLEVYIYDVTNAVIIQPSTYKLFSNTSLAGHFTANFQSASNSTSYRLIIHTATTSASAYTVQFDSVKVAPSTYIYGTPMGDWVDAGATTWTATTTSPTKGTTTRDKIWWRRVGDSAEIYVEYVQTGAGSAGSGNYLLALPTGLSIDSTKAPYYTTLATQGTVVKVPGGVGTGGQATYVTSDQGVPFAVQYDATRVRIFTTSTAQASVFDSASNYNFSQTSITLVARMLVPISGWSSSVQMSDSGDGRVVSFQANKSAGAVTANTVIPTWTNTVKDTHGAFNSSTGVYTVVIPGDYFVSFTAYTNSASVTGKIFKNGSTYIEGVRSTTTLSGGAFGIVPCVAGDTISVAVDASVTLSTSTTQTVLSIYRIAGPNAIGATESINMKYFNTAGTSIANSGNILVPFATKVYDSHNAYNTGTGQFTAPSAGKYRISGTVTFASSTYAANNQVLMSVYKNGALDTYGPNGIVYAALTSAVGNSVTTTVYCLAGETLEIRVNNTRTAGATLLDTGASLNHIEIERIGL